MSKKWIKDTTYHFECNEVKDTSCTDALVVKQNTSQNSQRDAPIVCEKQAKSLIDKLAHFALSSPFQIYVCHDVLSKILTAKNVRICYAVS
ncbi:hypothetical protein DP117_10235 [Brasilonema sp. UFV-L1]|nr:hypothetical protein [Brasilonema sp. UFV-L1]